MSDPPSGSSADGAAPRARDRHRGRMGPRKSAPRPRIFQHRCPYGRGQVHTNAGTRPYVRGGDNPERLRVAFETVRQSQPLPGQPVQHLLPQMPERRVPEVVRERGGLDHRRVAPTQPGHYAFSVHIGHSLGQPDGDLRDFQTVRQPVVQQQPRSGRADHLGDAGQPGKKRRLDHPVPVSSVRVAGRPRGTGAATVLVAAPYPRIVRLHCASVLR